MERLTLEQRFAAYSVPAPSGCLIWVGPHIGSGYPELNAEGTCIYAHRYAWERAHGPIPDGLQIDHICHVRSCVNVDHLRPVTNKQNQENRAGAQRNNASSGVRGVYWNGQRRKWIVKVIHNKHQYYGGLFTDLPEAATAAAALRARLFSHCVES